MISKRGFFRTIGAIIATVALAPEIAFGGPLKRQLSNPPEQAPFWYEESRYCSCYTDAYRKAMSKIMESNAYFEVMGG